MSYKYPVEFGKSKIVTLTAPAAGADFANTTVPGYTVWLLDSAYATLVTSAGVANRYPRIILDDGTNTFTTCYQGLTIASQTTDFNWAEFGTLSLPVTLGYLAGVAPLPQMPLPENYRIRFSTLNLQAGDQWSTGYLKVRQWLNPHA